ncbi:MAG: zinc-binding alcohol dehydrogenase family protein [Gorillibacterium sp.]|nr:zinc-binding alcohol dehydrogenase family protein [Gorillibacterium sp.]
MKTIVCNQINEFVMLDTEIPTPSPGEALIRIRRIGICGSDLHAFRGNQPFFSYPRILGHELSGTIESINGEANGLACGDHVAVIPYLECGKCVACRAGKTNCCTNMRVFGVHVDGGMREYLNVPMDHLVQANRLSLDEAVMLEPLSIGAHAVRRASVIPGETVLVIGAGPIGLGVMALAKRAGATVIAMDTNRERLNFCRTWAGVDHTIDATDQPEVELKTITDGDMASAVFDATGNARSMSQAFSYAANGGRVIYVGLVKADISFHDPDFHRKELTLMGSRNATREDFVSVLEAIESRSLQIGPYISHRTVFDELIEQFTSWLDPTSGVIKAIVEV